MIRKTAFLFSAFVGMLFASIDKEQFLETIHEKYLMNLTEGPTNEYAYLFDSYTSFLSHPLIKMEAERFVQTVKIIAQDFRKEASLLAKQFPEEEISIEYADRSLSFLNKVIEDDMLYNILLAEFGFYRYSFPGLSAIQTIAVEYNIKSKMVLDFYDEEDELNDYLGFLRDEKIRKIKGVIADLSDKNWKKELLSHIELYEGIWLDSKPELMAQLMSGDREPQNSVEEQMYQAMNKLTNSLEELLEEYIDCFL